MFQLPPVLLFAAATTTTGTLFLLPNIKQFLMKRVDNKTSEQPKMSLDRRRSLSAEVLVALRLGDQDNHQLDNSTELQADENNNPKIRSITCCTLNHSIGLSRDVEANKNHEDELDDETDAAPSRDRPHRDIDQLRLIGAQLRELSDQFQRYRQKRRKNLSLIG